MVFYSFEQPKLNQVKLQRQFILLLVSAVRQNVQLLKPFSFFFVILLPGYSKETKIRPSIGVGDGSKFQIIYKGQFWIITK